MSYINVFDGSRISDGWAEHLARGSGGGIDFAVGSGTPIKAPTSGRVENRPMTNGYGNYIRFHHGDGYIDEFLHLKDGGFVAEGNYNQGDVIGYTGSTGNSTGPHVHWHLINPAGKRVNPADFWGGSLPAVANDKADVQKMLADQGLYGGAIDGDPGPITWRAIQTWLNRYGLYGGAIDGIPGPLTYAGFQQYGAKNGNYSGPMDNVLGPRSWAGFAQTLREDIDAAKKAATPKPVTPEKPATPAKKPAPVKPDPAPVKPVTPPKSDPTAGKLKAAKDNLERESKKLADLRKEIETASAEIAKLDEERGKREAELATLIADMRNKSAARNTIVRNERIVAANEARFKSEVTRLTAKVNALKVGTA